MEERQPICVIGHRNPDTDSICSAICYARLKEKTEGDMYIAARAGAVNEETRYVLERFHVPSPRLIENITTQVQDIEIRRTEGISRFLSIRRAWTLMQEKEVYTLAVVSREGTLEGLITVGDIAKSYMNVYDSRILARAGTCYANILDTLQGTVTAGEVSGYAVGKVIIGAAAPETMETYIEKGDLVILGNRYESQLCAVEMGAACVIICEGAKVSQTIGKLAQERGCLLITTPYDAFTAARLIHQSIPAGFFMRTEHLTVFEDTDYIDEVKKVMSSKRHRDFPVIGDDGRYMGMISRRNLLGAKGKPVILVDHNERNQAVQGIEHAEIREIIDHHRIGAVETVSPVFFRNQPLGCTATIIYQMYQEQGVPVDKNTAALLCSAIVSDTLLFRSPTCTPTDKKAALDLAEVAELDVEELAESMFSAGSNLKDKTVEEIFYQDFKKFTAGELSFGVGQIITADKNQIRALLEPLEGFMRKALVQRGMDMMFFMVTNILTETTELICIGEKAWETVLEAFRQESGENQQQTAVILNGVVSRKKQLVPKLIAVLQS